MMRAPDYAHLQTEKELSALERRIASVYGEAQKDLDKTVKTYFEQFAARDAEQRARLEAGEITAQYYQQWRLNQIGRGKRFEAMRDKAAERVTDANQVARSYVQDTTPGIYTLNRNYAAYTIEQVSDRADFSLWDESTVRRMIVEQPDVMPYYSPTKALNRGIDLKYGKEQITKSVTSSIIQGRSISDISDDLQRRITTMSRDSAIRTARTAVTAAQNAGRMDSYAAAEKMGIKLRKEWLATLDGRTRHAHAMLDGQTQEYDKPFDSELGEIMFPGDPDADPANTYNCRCTLIADVEGVDTSDAQRRARDPETGESVLVSDMTYSEWAGWKDEYSTGDAITFTKDKYKAAKELVGDILEQNDFTKYGFRVQEEDTEVVGAEMLHHSRNFGGDFEVDAENGEELDGVSVIGTDNIGQISQYGGYYGRIMYLIGADNYEYGYDPGELILKEPTVLAKMKIENGRLVLADKIETKVSQNIVEKIEESVPKEDYYAEFAGTKEEVDEYIHFRSEMFAKYGEDHLYAEMTDAELDKLDRLERIAYKGR